MLYQLSYASGHKLLIIIIRTQNCNKRKKENMYSHQLEPQPKEISGVPKVRIVQSRSFYLATISNTSKAKLIA